MRITVIDTPGYDPNSKESVHAWQQRLEKELQSRFSQEISILEQSTLSNESKNGLSKSPKVENKVHVVFHLVDGSDFSTHNVAAINSLSEFCSIIPVLSKGDLLEFESPRLGKELVLKAALTSGIKWIDFREVHISN